MQTGSKNTMAMNGISMKTNDFVICANICATEKYKFIILFRINHKKTIIFKVTAKLSILIVRTCDLQDKKYDRYDLFRLLDYSNVLVEDTQNAIRKDNLNKEDRQRSLSTMKKNILKLILY